jgi:hypothetical protein
MSPDANLKELFLNKPECVIDLPKWLLPPEKIAVYQSVSGLAIVEIAGRDSVAAAIRAVEENGFTDLIPTYVYTGTEYGPWEAVGKAVGRLATRLPGVQVHELLLLGSPKFWQALNGRFVTELVSRYGFYTPCLGCHLYLHATRIPLAVMLGKVPIIAGERERHDQAIKLNQLSEALNIYQDLAAHFEIDLLLPLRHISEGTRIGDILGFEWQGGREQLGCVLSGNYRRCDGTTENVSPLVRKYLEEFAGPCTERILQSYGRGKVPDHLAIGANLLESPIR